MTKFRARILRRTRCAVCGENDPCVLVQCRDDITRCAHHANEAGWCWWCGDNEPRWYNDEQHDGMCFDCRASEQKARKIFGIS